MTTGPPIPEIQVDHEGQSQRWLNENITWISGIESLQIVTNIKKAIVASLGMFLNKQSITSCPRGHRVHFTAMKLLKKVTINYLNISEIKIGIHVEFKMHICRGTCKFLLWYYYQQQGYSKSRFPSNLNYTGKFSETGYRVWYWKAASEIFQVDFRQIFFTLYGRDDERYWTWLGRDIAWSYGVNSLWHSDVISCFLTAPIPEPNFTYHQWNFVAFTLLTSLINNCMKWGIFPENMKLANVSPIYKKSDNLMKGNYRPVSAFITL